MIIELQIENFKRIKTAIVKPKAAGAVIVAGKNEQGKTSFIDAIQAVIADLKHSPAKPIRRGESKSKIVMKTDTIIATRTYDAKGSRLTVKRVDGKVMTGTSRQILDEFYGKLTFDPLAFAREKAKEQAKILGQIVGLDFTAENAARASAYTDRTVVGQEIKRLQGAVDSAGQVPDGTPDEEVSVSDLSVEVERRLERNAANEAKRVELVKLRELGKKQRAAVMQLEKDIAEAREAFARTSERGPELSAEVDALEDLDVEEIREQIKGAEETNRNVRLRATIKTQQDELDVKINLSEKLTERINQIDAVKADAIAKAKYPINGLAVTDDGVTLDGLPFEDGSQSGKLKASVAIGIALNPGKAILSRDGSLLDEDNLALVDKLAADAGVQFFVEVVGENDAATVVFEDGLVKGE